MSAGFALIHVVASEPHFVDHLAPIWEALPEQVRGNFYCGSPERRNELALIRAREYHGIRAKPGYLPSGSRGLCLVGAVGDLSRARSNSPRMRFAFTEHGCGITYEGGGASYVGSTKRPNVDLILVPNLLSKRIQDRATPEIEVISIGSSPRLDPWAPGQPAREQALNRSAQWDPSQPDQAMNRATIALSFHWDLIPEGSTVSGPAPTGASVRWYEGPLAEVETTATDRLSCSPDHPVLTVRGWVRAGELVEGDHLVRCGWDGRHGVRGPDTYLPPTRVEDVAGALLEPLKVSARAVPSSAPYLNGDRPDGEVDVVGADGFLRNGFRDAAFGKEISEPGFEGTALCSVGLPGGGSLAEFSETGGGVGTGLVHGETAQVDSRFVEDTVDGALADPEAFSQFVAGCASEVTVHKVTNVSVRQYAGHGYDFTTVPHWYLTNGYVTHNCKIVPETRTALPWYRKKLDLVLDGPWDVIGHGHPRAWPTLKIVYDHWGIEKVRSFDHVMSRADCYVVDNSSTLYEFAATGRPVVVLNCPRYRRDVHHGLRFWDHIPGIQCDSPEDLPGAIELALEDPPELREIREEAVAAVYPQHDGHATDRAVEALLAVWERVRVKEFSTRSPVTEYIVRDVEGDIVEAYLVEYEARTHAKKIGGSFDSRTQGAALAV